MGQITGENLANKRGQRSIDPLIMPENTNKYGNLCNLCKLCANLAAIHQQMRAALPKLRCFLNWWGRGSRSFRCAGCIDGLRLTENIVNAALASVRSHQALSLTGS